LADEHNISRSAFVLELVILTGSVGFADTSSIKEEVGA
jgi:hypothetical protein